MRRISCLGALAFSCVGPVACMSRDEVARVPAPNGKVEAVLYETNAGATVSFGYEVRVVRARSSHGPLVAELYGAVRSDSAYGVNLRWKDTALLAIEYLEAKTDTVLLREARVTGHRIRVELRPGIVDPRAPAGGMLWNLQGRR